MTAVIRDLGLIADNKKKQERRMIFDALIILVPIAVWAIALLLLRRYEDSPDPLDTKVQSHDILSSDDSDSEVDDGLRHSRPWH